MSLNRFLLWVLSWLGLFCLLLMSCTRSTTTLPVQIKIVYNNYNKFPSKSESFAQITGESIPKTLKIPLWLSLDKSEEPADCVFRTTLDAFLIESHLLYVSQDNLRCSTNRACQLYHFEKASWIQPKYCLSSPTGAQMSVQVLGKSMFFVFGYQEGPGIGEIVIWTPKTQQKTVLAHITSPARILQVKDGYHITSACHPKTGRVPKITWKAKTCRDLSSKCNHCAMNYGTKYLWHWDPQSNTIKSLGEASTNNNNPHSK